jgi:hypothetical protein
MEICPERSVLCPIVVLTVYPVLFIRMFCNLVRKDEHWFWVTKRNDQCNLRQCIRNAYLKLTHCITLFFKASFQYPWPPLWSSGQSSWLQIQRSGSDSRRYQIFWLAVGLEWGPFSLVSKIGELLRRNCGGFGLESLEYGRGDPLRWPRYTLYPQKLLLRQAAVPRSV